MNPMNQQGSRGAASGNAGRSRAAGKLQGDIIPKGHRLTQLQNFDPEQMQLYEQSMGHLGPDSYLNRLASGDEELLRESEAPAWRDFQESQGQLASRFSGFGMGGRHGSGFKNAANQQSQDFAMQLQSRRQDLQRQAISDLMGFSNQMLNQRPYERSLQEKPEKKSSGWGSIAGGLIGGIGAPFLGIDPMTGASAGSAIGGMF